MHRHSECERARERESERLLLYWPMMICTDQSTLGILDLTHQSIALGVILDVDLDSHQALGVQAFDGFEEAAFADCAIVREVGDLVQVVLQWLAGRFVEFVPHDGSSGVNEQRYAKRT
jgi:hypothetical protein